MASIKLLHIKRLRGTIRVLTGLHVGAGREVIEIGGMDNPVLKDPVTGEPYIPGSSLKGKMRSILEAALGKVDPNGEVFSSPDPACPITRVFGSTRNDVNYGPTRIIVRDARLNREETRKVLKNLDENFAPSDILEEKYENFIDRIKGRAEHPRPQERVVPGCAFDFEILYKVYDVDGDGGRIDESLYINIDRALVLIEHDYIGGNGTRGCGQVKFIRPNLPEIIEPEKLLQEVS